MNVITQHFSFRQHLFLYHQRGWESTPLSLCPCGLFWVSLFVGSFCSFFPFSLSDTSLKMLDLQNWPFIYLLSSIYHQYPFLLLSRRFSQFYILLWKFIRLSKIHGEKEEIKSCSVMSDSLWPHGLYNSWNSPGQNTGVGSCSLLQGIFPTQGLNLGLLHCRWVLYQLSHKGSPIILDWVAYPFSRGSSWPRKQTEVSCFAGRFSYPWFNIFRSLFLGSSDFPEKCFSQTAAWRVKAQLLGFWKPSGVGGLRVMYPVCTHLPNLHTHT